jgi:8-oxo-dGTP pyrophosphatase MutT (NUDIX family)
VSDVPDRPQSAASAIRRGTDDDRVFLIPEDALPPGFAARVEAGGWEAPAPRPAATVVLARDAAGGPEVLMLRRHGRSGFAAGAWVFPGGVVDAADRDAVPAGLLAGPYAEAWGARLGTDGAAAAAYVAAALREAFEETGILLAVSPDGAAAAPPAERLEARRAALLGGTETIVDVARDLGVRLDGGGVSYLAHWITPEPEPRRYDTRFFLASVPADAECRTHAGEMTDARWMTPAAAVDAFRRGEMVLLPPTVHTLRRLAPFPTVAAMAEAVRGAPVPPILPVMRRDPDGVAIVVPPEA